MAIVQLQVSPGVTISADTTKVDAALLNMLARPVVSIPEGAGIGPEHLDMTALLEAAGDALRGINFISRPNFWGHDWKQPDEAVICPPDVRTENSFDWYVHPDAVAESDQSVEYSRVQAWPDGRSCYGAQLVGEADVEKVRFSNWLSEAISGQLREETMTFSLYVKNNTNGLAYFRPFIWSADVVGAMETVVESYVGEAESVEAGEWERLTFTFAAGDLPNFKNGCFIGFETEQLDSNLKSVIFAQGQLEVSGTAGVFKRPTLPPVPRDDGVPPCFDGDDKEQGAHIILAMEDGQRRTLCAPHPGLLEPMLSWNRAGNYPEWVSTGENKLVLEFVGSDQLLTVPEGIDIMRVKLWGAGGSNDYSTPGGVGGFSEASFDVLGGMQFMAVVGQSAYHKTSRTYGFGGKAHAHQYNGGGLSGVFIGNSPVVDTDTARAVIVAGGGGAGRESFGGEKRAGGNGSNPTHSGGQSTMQGQDGYGPTAYVGTGGGGGGYAGGSDWARAGFGGTGFVLAAPLDNGGTDVVLRAGDDNGEAFTPQGSYVVPRDSDDDYRAPIGLRATPKGAPQQSNGLGGHGMIVVEWAVAP